MYPRVLSAALAALVAAAAIGVVPVAAADAHVRLISVDVPASSPAGQLIPIKLVLSPEVSAVDGRLSIDPAAGEVVGVAPGLDGTGLRPVATGTATAFGAFDLGGSAKSTTVSILINPTGPGVFPVRISIDAAADSKGGRLHVVGGSRLVLLHVPGGRLHSIPPALAALPAPREGGGISEPVADGVINDRDIDTVRAGWDAARGSGSICSPTDPAPDVNRDGCVDIVDLQAISAVQSHARTPSGPSALVANVLTVTSTLDTPDAAPGNGTCADSQGRCTLRAAMTEADWLLGEDRIEFNVPGTAPVRIQIGSRLPIITSRSGGVIIDAYTQPGSSINTATVGSNAVPGIELRGNGQSARELGFYMTSADNTIRGFVMSNLWRGVFIDGADASNNRVVGNWIGYTPAGLASGGQYGIVLNVGAHDNFIGTPALEDRNVIGNWAAGIDTYGPGTNGNTVQNNLFCIRPSGVGTATCSTAIDHNFGPKFNLFGGAGPNEKNVIGPTLLQGIEYSHGWNPAGPPGQTDPVYAITDNRSIGNWVGFRADGSYDASYRSGLNASSADNAQGINVYDGTLNNLIEGNYVASVYDGIQIQSPNSTGNILRNNIIGVSPLGQAAPLTRWGINIRWGTRFNVVEGNQIQNAALGGIGLILTNNSGQPTSPAYNIKLTKNIIGGTNGPAIDLRGVAGPDPNDVGDADDGANTLFNTPIITSAQHNAIGGTGFAGATVEVYKASRPAGQYGLPTEYLGAATVTAGGTWTLPVTLLEGDRVTALQFRPDGNTSELSPNVLVLQTSPDFTVAATPPTRTIAARSSTTYSVTVTPGGGFTGPVALSVSGLPAGATGTFVPNPLPITSGAASSTLTVSTTIGTPVGTSSLLITATSGVLSHTASVGLTVTAGPNTAPVVDTVVISPTGPTTAQVLTATVTSHDADSDPLTTTYQWSRNGTDIVGATAATLDLALAGNGDRGDLIRVRVTVNDGLATSPPVTADPVTVANSAPVFSTEFTDRSDAEDAVISFDADATDADAADTLTYSATNLPDGITINPSTGVVSGTLTATSAGTYAVVLTVSDGTLTDTDSFAWTVTEPARAPVFSTEFGDRSDNESDVVSFDADATDANPADTLTYSATNLPDGISIDSSTGMVSGTLSATSAGVHAVVLTVSDGTLTDTDSFTWTVIEPNVAPVFSTEFTDRSDDEGALISFDADASDANAADTLTYSATNLPDGISIDSSTGVVSGTLGATSAGVHAVVLTVSDGIVTDTDSFTWTVIEPNVAPVFSTEFGNRSDDEGSVISFDADASDANAADTLTYSATNLPDGISIDSSTGVVSGTLSATSSGVYSVVLTVSDGTLDDTDSFTWTVTEPAVNEAPVFSTEFTDRSDDEGTVISGFDANASDANPGDTLTYSATNLPDGISINSSTGVVSGTLSATSAGVHAVVLTVSDETLTDTDSFTWTVTEPNGAPVFSTEFTNRTDPEGTVVSFDADATDANPGDTLTYSATNLPDGISINSSTGVVSGTLSATSAGSYAVVLTVSDGTLTDTDSFTWTVTEPAAPTVYADDLFSRTVVNAWGSAAPTGGAYTLSGTAADFDVTGSAGTLLMAAGVNRAAVLGGVSALDVDLSFSVATNKTAVGGFQYVYGVARRVNANSEYRIKLRLGTNGSVTVQGTSVVNNVETNIGAETTVPGLTHTANGVIRVRAQISGTNPTTIRIRAWADGSPEPSTWTYTATSTTASLQAAGAVGLRSYVAGGITNAPVLITFDDFRVTSIAP